MRRDFTLFVNSWICQRAEKRSTVSRVGPAHQLDARAGKAPRTAAARSPVLAISPRWRRHTARAPPWSQLRRRAAVLGPSQRGRNDRAHPLRVNQAQEAAGWDLRDRARTGATSSAARSRRPTGWGSSRLPAPAARPASSCRSEDASARRQNRAATIIAPSGTRSPMMVKAQVSPGFATNTKPQIAQRSM